MRSFTRWLTASVILLGLSCQVHAANLALVVGINGFPDLPAKSQLQRAVADAEAVGDALQDLGFHVTRVTRDGSLDAIYNAFDLFTHQIQQGDIVVVYYAGHGMALEDGNYLLPADFPTLGRTDPRVAKRHAFSERDLKLSLRAAGSRAAVVVLDARPIDEASHGLARGHAGDGILEIEAAREGQTALDRLSPSDPNTTSLFARVFIKTVKTPGINLGELGGAVRDEVASLARSINVEQVPAVSDDLIGAREVYLAGRAAPAPVASAGLSADELLWSIIKGTSDPKQIDSFLAQFPQSRARAEAEARRAELNQVAASPPAPVAQTPAAPTASPQQGAGLPDSATAECDRLAALSFDTTRPAGVPGHHANDVEDIDSAKAIPVCRAALAARPGDARLKLQLGFALLAGSRQAAADDPKTPALWRESLDLLQQSSEAGNMAARAMLGFISMTGSDEAAKPKGLAMVREAAAAGVGYADAVLGYAYEHGLAVAADKAEALHWYRKGADAGDPGAKVDYDRLSAPEASASAPSPAAPVAPAPAPQAAAPDPALAECDRLAAVSFDPTRPAGVAGHGADELATLDGGPAVKACRAALAARPGEPRLKLQLGFALLADVEGRLKAAAGDPEAPPLARESLDLLKQASEAGNMAARTLLGFTTIEGSDEAAKPKGLDMVRDAAAAGIGFANDVMGYAYEQGLAVAVDKTEALNWYRKGAALGDTGSKADFDRLSQAETAAQPAAPVAQAPAAPAGPAVPPAQESASTPTPAAIVTAECDRLTALSFDTTRPAGVPGLSVDQVELLDGRTAVPYCRAALALHPGDPRRKLQLGIALIKTKSTGQGDDTAKAREGRELLTQASDAGNVAAQTVLGAFVLESGTSDPELQQGLALLRKAADGGVAFANDLLGNAYERGRGVPADPVEALSWYRKGEAQGDEHSKADAERLAKAQPAPAAAPPAKPAPAPQAAAPDPALAECDRLAAVSFDPTRPAGVAGHGADELATLDGGPAVKACRAALAARPGDPRLKLQLGFALLADVEGRLKAAAGDPEAPPLARESLDLLKQASEAGNMAARTLLGFTTIEGSDEAAKPKGLDMVRDAAAAGIGFANDVMGYAYEQGLAVGVDKTEALNWYRKGAALGDAGSKADFDRLSQAAAAPAEPAVPAAPAPPATQAPATPAPAAPAVPPPAQEGANTPDPAATVTAECDRLTALSFDTTRPAGVPGIGLRQIQDMDAAAAMPACRAALAAHPQDVRLMLQFGIALIRESNKGDKPSEEGIRLIRQAAEAGNAAAMALLGTFYIETHDQDHKAEALELIRKAAEGGVPFAMTALGSAYEFGDGLGQDNAQAEAWYRKAIAAGDEDATGRLAHVLAAMQPSKPFILPAGATLEPKGATAKPVNVVKLSADGHTALMAGDGMIVQWDLTNGTVTRSFAPPTGDVHALALSPDSTALLSAGYRNVVKLWDMANGQVIKSLDARSDWPDGTAFTQDGNTAIVAENELIGLWDVSTGRFLRELKGHRDSIEALTVSPDGRLLASASRDNTVRLWSLPAGNPVRTLKGSTNALSAESVAFAPDGKTLVFGGYDGTITLWDVASGKMLRSFKGLTATIYSLAFSADGRSILSGTGEGALKLWDVASGKIRQSFNGHTASVGSVAFSPDGRTILSGSRDGTMKLWAISTGRPLATYFASESSWGSFNADGLFVTSGDPASSIALKQGGADLGSDDLIAHNRRKALPDVLSAAD